MEGEILRLQSDLAGGEYGPGPYRFFLVRDPKQRLICAPCFRDRVVHHAICEVVGPVFERSAIHDSYACRPGKGTHAAVRRAREFVRGGGFFLKMDVEKFYDSVDRATMKRLFSRLVKDRRMLDLMDLIVDAAPAGAAHGKGIPIGALTSQHFANLYLSGLDHFVKETLRARRYLRYMDDLLMFADDKATLHGWSAGISDFAGSRLGLALKPSATVVAPVSEGAPFLGLRIWPSVVRLGGKRRRRFISMLRKADAAMHGGSSEAALPSMAGSIEGAMSAGTLRLRRAVVGSILGREGAHRARTG